MAGAPNRVFIARLAGVAVLDPNGDRVGRVRDVVVTLRMARQPPRVLGMVVEVQPRRRVFVPMGRVTSIDVGAVLITGAVNLRRFDKRPGETLVIGELLDRRVQLVEDGVDVPVVDVGMEQTRTRDWLVTRVAVSVGGGNFRRRGEVRTLAWDGVTGFTLAEDVQRAANLANVLHELSAKRRGEVAAALDIERLADVLEELPEDDQIEILAKLSDERAGDVLEEMAPDDAADLLNELPADERERLLELMEPDEAEPVRRLLSYSDDTAGGMMTTEPIILSPDASVAEALARVRSPEVSPALATQVYVVRPPTETPTGRYLGIAHIQRLLREVPSSLVSAVIDTDIAPLSPATALSGVTSYLATYNLVAVPVVDEANHLLGAVSVDDVLDHLRPADWRDRDRDRDAEDVARGA